MQSLIKPGARRPPVPCLGEERISVVVPSYLRPGDLASCLEALEAQRLAPHEVLVVLRPEDSAGRACAASAALKPRIITVHRPGQVAALNQGCAAATGEIIAITDDDARPRPEWVAAIAARFATDAGIGAVGGRDVVHWDGSIVDGYADVVGRVRWWGRRIGNHHLQSVLQDVDFVKGANMGVRARALQPFDERLWGTGSQICNDMEATWSIRRRGWRVVYDPDIIVDHYPAERENDDKRIARSEAAERDEQHNEVCALVRHAATWQKPMIFTYSLLIGSRQSPGLVMAMFPGRGHASRPRAVGLARARCRALRTSRPRGRRRPRDVQVRGRKK